MHPKLWKAGDGDGSGQTGTHKLYDEPVPEGFSTADESMLPPAKVMLSDLWKMHVAPLNAADRHAKWPASFNTKGKVVHTDLGYGKPAIITHNGARHYAVLFGNVHLAGDDLRRFKGLGRFIGNVPSARGGIVKAGKKVPEIFSSRSLEMKAGPRKTEETPKRKADALEEEESVAGEDEEEDEEPISYSTKKAAKRRAASQSNSKKEEEKSIAGKDEEEPVSRLTRQAAKRGTATKSRTKKKEEDPLSEETSVIDSRHDTSSEDELQGSSKKTTAALLKKTLLSKQRFGSESDGKVKVSTKKAASGVSVIDVESSAGGILPGLLDAGSRPSFLRESSATSKLFTRSPHRRPPLSSPKSGTTVSLSKLIAAQEEIFALRKDKDGGKHLLVKAEQLVQNLGTSLAVFSRAAGTLSEMLHYAEEGGGINAAFQSEHFNAVRAIGSEVERFKALYNMDFLPALRESKTQPWRKGTIAVDLQEFCVAEQNRFMDLPDISEAEGNDNLLS